ncbi:MAG: hypothetical protein WC781_05735 [Candidatus Pacearchaeota archaeon]|jgi:hypothetical protein
MTYKIKRQVIEGYIPLSDRIEKELDLIEKSRLWNIKHYSKFGFKSEAEARGVFK